MCADDVDTRFRLGINYWPSRTAMRWWSAFDRAEVEADFARIAAGGFDSVRCFLLWEAFQPEPDRVDTVMLDRLVSVADAAERAGLMLVPTLFTGHMSGVDWIPAWALGGTERDARFRVVSGARVVPDGVRNWYADADILRAQVAAWRARRPRRSPGTRRCGRGTWGTRTPTARSLLIGRPRGDGWRPRPARSVRPIPAAAVTIGIHMEDLEEDRRLGPAEAAESCDFLTMHGYPIYAAWSDGPTDELLVPFLARVTRWLGGGADVLFSEFGLPTAPRGERAQPPFVAEDEAARYTERVLHGLRVAGCTGAMLWCYGDYDPRIWSDPPLDEAVHERSFGLWRADGSAEAGGRTSSARSPAPRVRRLPTTVGSTSTPTATGSGPASSSRGCTAASRRRRSDSA